MLARVALVCVLFGATSANADPDAAPAAPVAPDAATAVPDAANTAAAANTATNAAPTTDTTATTTTISPARRAAAIGGAIFPGVVARGLGSHVAQRPRTRNRLLQLGGVGLGAVVVGGAPILATYGSGKVIVPGVHLAVAGAGIFVGSWLTDIYTAAGGDRLGGRARSLPPLAVELTTMWQRDDYLGDRAFVAPAADLRSGAWLGRAAGLFALDGSAYGGRLDVELRPWAVRPPDASPAAPHTGSSLGIRSALQYHAEPDQGFALATGEIAVRARLDLGDVDRGMRGTFLDLDEGLGLELVDYDHAGVEVNTILLSRVAWGMYLPRGSGEVSAFYDHRRDHLAGGLSAGRAAGFFGSVGVDAELAVASPWRVLARVELGSSLLTTIGLRREVP